MSDGLTVVQIVQMTGIGIDTLNRYLKHDSVREYMGAFGKPPRYPESSLPLFHTLKGLHERKAIKPDTLPNMLPALSTLLPTVTLTDASMRNVHSAQNALVPSTQVEDGVSLLREIRDAMLANAGDKLLTPAQSAEYLSCSAGSVSRYVTSARRGKYRLSDIQAYIRSLTPMPAKAKTAKPMPQIPSKADPAE